MVKEAGKSLKELMAVKRLLQLKGRCTEDIYSDLLMEFNGTPYVWGCATPAASDCSGSICCVLNTLFNTHRRYTAQVLYMRFFTKIEQTEGIKALFFMEKKSGNILHVCGEINSSQFMNVSSIERYKCGTVRTLSELEAMYPDFILLERTLDVGEWCNE